MSSPLDLDENVAERDRQGEDGIDIPGGPYNNKWGNLPASMNFSTTHELVSAI